MKNFFRKQNLKRGASLTIALLIFLLCVLAGVTALTMAMTNIGRYSHAQEDQQPYYTVSSAALLMVDLLDGTVYNSPTVKYYNIREWEHKPVGAESSHPQSERNTLNVLDMDETYGEGKKGPDYLNSFWNTGDNASQISVYHTVVKDNKEKEEIDDSNPLNAKNGSFELLTQLKDYCDKLVCYLVVPQEWYSTMKFRDESGKEQDPGISVEDFLPEKSLNYSFTVTAGTFGTVSARLVMEDNFNLILSFTYRESFGDEMNDVAFYAVNVYWTATVEETTDSKQSEFVYAKDGKSGSMTSEQTKKVTVRWDKKNVMISRGEAYEATDD